MAQLETSHDGRPSAGAPPHPELATVFEALSPAAHGAFAVADGVRGGFGRDAVGLEHLLVGIWTVDEAGPFGNALQIAGWPLDAVLRCLANAGLDAPDAQLIRRDAPRGVRRGVPVPMPLLSPEVQSLLQRLGERFRGARIEIEELLAAAFEVRESPAIRALEEARPAIERIIGHPLDETNETNEGRFDAEEHLPEEDGEERPRPRVGSGPGARNDRAAGEDRLGFDHYVQAFADLADSPNTQPPLTIGIYGSWGAGKSFLLTKLREELDARRARPRPAPPARPRAPVYSVYFNAWEYNASPQIWPRLVRRILDGVEDALSRATRRALRRRRFWPNLRRKLVAEWKNVVAWWIVCAFLVFVLTAAASALGQALFEFAIIPFNDKFTLAAVLGGVGTLLKSVRDAFVAPLGEWITAALDDGRSYGLESGGMAVVRMDLERLDVRLKDENARVLVVIDDLDRCEPEKAVEMLQAINLLLDRPSFVICLGIDARVITAAIEKHYEDLLGPAGLTGYEYLDKIVQIPFRIPPPTPADLKRLMSMQLGDPTPDRHDPVPTTAGPAGTVRSSVPPTDVEVETPLGMGPGQTPSDLSARERAEDAAAAAAQLSFTHDELRAFEEVAPFLRANPRHVKRLVNVYALVRSLASSTGSQALLDDPASTVRWLTLCAQWPYAVHEMLRHLDTHGAPDSGSPDGNTPPLRWLHDAVRATLDPVRQARYDHDDRLLEQLVASSDELSWDEVHALRAYTVNFNPALDSELRTATTNRRRRAGARGAAAYDRRASLTRDTASPEGEHVGGAEA